MFFDLLVAVVAVVVLVPNLMVFQMPQPKAAVVDLHLDILTADITLIIYVISVVVASRQSPAVYQGRVILILVAELRPVHSVLILEPLLRAAEQTWFGFAVQADAWPESQAF
jgi:hypothetical protein